jgi:hypothetical protein
MESKNPLVRLVTFGKIKRMITSYTGHKLKTIDQRLLRGLFIKKLRDFDEEFLNNMGQKSLLERIKHSHKFSDSMELGGKITLDPDTYDKQSINIELGGRHYDDLFMHSNRRTHQDP